MGSGFIKICTYFPDPLKAWANGHEWAKRPALAAGIGFRKTARPAEEFRRSAPFGPAEAAHRAGHQASVSSSITGANLSANWALTEM